MFGAGLVAGVSVGSVHAGCASCDILKGGSYVIQDTDSDLYWVKDRGGNGANDD